jgi:hypothetical protein
MTQLADFEGRNPLAKVMGSKTLDELDSLVSQYNPLDLVKAGPFKQALAMASTVSMLRERMSAEMMQLVLPLQGTPLGFLTDRDKNGGYPMEAVRDVFIEATMRGARMIGNEVNIIGGRCYLTKEFFARKVREHPGLSDLHYTLSVPRIVDFGAVVDASARWHLDGNRQTLERSFPIKVNQGMTGDAILGKATRKLLAAIYGKVTGSEHAFPEGEVEDLAPGARTAADINRKLADLDVEQKAGEAGAGREVVLPTASAPGPSPKAEEPPFEDAKEPASKLEEVVARRRKQEPSLGDVNAKPPAATADDALEAAFAAAGKGVRR